MVTGPIPRNPNATRPKAKTAGAIIRPPRPAVLTPYGVLVNQVILHEHRFHPDYERVIHDRKLAEQRGGYGIGPVALLRLW